MVYIKKEFNYVGIDETGLPGRGQNLILVMAQTSDEKLAEIHQFGTFKKSADYLKEAGIVDSKKRSSNLGLSVQLPDLDELMRKGMDCFYWMRSNNGRFSRQLLEHLSIAHMITETYDDLSKVVLFVDAFHSKDSIGQDLIYRCIKLKGKNIPKRNIVFKSGADRSIEIVSFADLIAYQICLAINNRYSQFGKDYLGVGKTKEIRFDEERLAKNIAPTERDELEEIVKKLQFGKR